MEENSESELTPKIKLKRFCYLGSYNSVYVHRRKYVNVSIYFPLILKICDSLDQETFLQILKDVLSRHSLVRRDEPIFAYATYLASNVEAKQKTIMREAITIFLTSDDDLFLFAKYSKLIQDMENRKGFSRTTQKAIQSWYTHQSSENLLKMWCTHRGKYSYSHANLIHSCKISEKMLGDSHLKSAFLKKCSKLLDAAEETAKLKKLKSKNDLNSENNTLETNNSEDDVLTKNPIALTIIEVSKLRNTENEKEALKIIKNYNLNYDQVPTNFLRYPKIIHHLLPKLSHRELLKNCRQLLRIHELKNLKTWSLIKSSLRYKKKRLESDIHPLEFLVLMDNIGIRWNKNIANLKSMVIRESRIPFFNLLYKESFGQNNETGLRMCITMNLQDSYKQKLLKNCRKLRYIEAAVALAFGYFKTEKICNVFAFTKERFKLNRLSWTKDMDIAYAMSSCENYLNLKTGALLVAPIAYSLTQSDIYDLFIVIVPTAGRNNPKQKSEFLTMFLDKYRLLKNPRAKFVIVNLRKFKKSMEYSVERNENILEICGIDEHTVNLINDFALNRFQ